MATTDWGQAGAAAGQDTAAKNAAFQQYVAGLGIQKPSGVNYDDYKRYAEALGNAKLQFEAQYQGSLTPEAPVTPQYQYNFNGSVADPGIMEKYANQTLQHWNDQPSALSDYWGKTQQLFAPPGQGDQYWNQVQGGVQSASNAPNRAAQAFDQAQGLTQNLDPYFDYARQRGQAEIRQAAGARGMLRSTGALQQEADLLANLGGQQAQAEGQYGLNRASMLGQMGSAADASGRGNSQNALSWLQGAQQYQYQPLMYGAQVAGQVDQNNLTRALGGAQIAGAGQNALRNRSQDYFNNQMGLAGQQAGNIMGVYGNAFAQDQNAFENGLNGNMMAARENLTASQNKASQNAQNLGTGIALYSAFNQPTPQSKPGSMPGTNPGFSGSYGGGTSAQWKPQY